MPFSPHYLAKYIYFLRSRYEKCCLDILIPSISVVSDPITVVLAEVRAVTNGPSGLSELLANSAHMAEAALIEASSGQSLPCSH